MTFWVILFSWSISLLWLSFYHALIYGRQPTIKSLIKLFKAFWQNFPCQFSWNFKKFWCFEQPLAWLVDFIDQRTLQLWFNDILSFKCSVLSRAPQGNVLGALLFYYDPLFHVHNCHIFMFSGDCKTFDSLPRFSLDFSSIQNDFSIICACCQNKQMQISVDKCQLLTLKSEQNDKIWAFYLRGNAIPNAQNVRDLSMLTFRLVTTVYVLKEIFLEWLILFSETLKSVILCSCYNCTSAMIPFQLLLCAFYFHSKNINWVECVQKVFTKRLCGPNSSHLSYSIDWSNSA